MPLAGRLKTETLRSPPLAAVLELPSSRDRVRASSFRDVQETPCLLENRGQQVESSQARIVERQNLFSSFRLCPVSLAKVYVAVEWCSQRSLKEG